VRYARHVDRDCVSVEAAPFGSVAGGLLTPTIEYYTRRKRKSYQFIRYSGSIGMEESSWQLAQWTTKIQCVKNERVRLNECSCLKCNLVKLFSCSNNTIIKISGTHFNALLLAS